MSGLLRFIFSLLISVSIIVPVSSILDYGLGSETILTMILFVNVVFTILLYNSRILRWFLITAGLALVGFCAAMLALEGKLFIPAGISSYFSDLFNAVVFSSFITPDMFLPTTFLIVSGISLAVILLIQKLKAYLILYTVMFAYFAALIIYGFDIDHNYFLLFIFTALSMHFEKYYSDRLINGKVNKGLLTILPSLLIFAVLLTVLPSFASSHKSDPVRFVDDVISEIRTIDFRLGRSDSEMVISYQTETAFSEGRSSFDTTLIMVVNSPGEFYLRSQVYDNYDGLNWSVSENIETANSEVFRSSVNLSLEIIENILGLYSLKYDTFPDILNDETLFRIGKEFFDTYELDITYSNIRTRAVFAPANTYMIMSDAGRAFELDLFKGIYSSRSILEKDFRYTAKVFAPKKNTAEFGNLLRKGGSVSYIGDLMIFPNREAYLQIPDSVPERVSELAHTITEGYDNDYDKLRAIERYLSANYRYSLNVPPTPQDGDFVDHFLFEGKEGFCTYYASAMVIMSRTLQIPARYVRGYIMPKKTSMDDMFDDIGRIIGMNEGFFNSAYHIYERYAHAWPEVYINGYGWLTFEPTSAYYASSLPSGQPDTGLPQEELPDMTEPVIPVPASGNGVFLAIIRTALAAMLFLLLMSPFIHRLILKKRYVSCDNRNRILITFKKLLELLKLPNYDIEPYETARKFAERVDTRLYLGKDPFVKVVGIYEKARYSDKKLTITELLIIEDFYQAARKEVLSVSNSFKTAFFYIKGSI